MLRKKAEDELDKFKFDFGDLKAELERLKN